MVQLFPLPALTPGVPCPPSVSIADPQEAAEVASMSLFSSPTGGRDPLLHLIGHPLPACIDSPCTSASPNASTGADAGAGAAREEGPPASTVDLFLLSLEKPILLFLFPGVGRGAGAEAGQNDSTAASSSSSSNLPARTCVSQLMSVQRSLAALRAAERKETGGELQMFGMSTAPVQELEEWRSRVGIEVSLLEGAENYQRD